MKYYVVSKDIPQHILDAYINVEAYMLNCEPTRILIHTPELVRHHPDFNSDRSKLLLITSDTTENNVYLTLMADYIYTDENISCHITKGLSDVILSKTGIKIGS